MGEAHHAHIRGRKQVSTIRSLETLSVPLWVQKIGLISTKDRELPPTSLNPRFHCCTGSTRQQMNLEAQPPLVFLVNKLRDDEGEGDVLGILWRRSETNPFFGGLRGQG